MKAWSVLTWNWDSEEEKNKNYWYALLCDENDYDWGDGTYDRDEAVSRLKYLLENGYPEAYIAVVDDHTDDPVCEYTIRADDL